MRKRFIFRTETLLPEEPYLFGDVFVRRQSHPLPLLASAVAHGCALALIPALLQAMSGYDPPPQHKNYHLEVLHLQLPDRIYLPAAHLHPEQPAQAQKSVAPSPSPQAAAASGAHSPAPAALLLMELPVTRHSSNQQPVILQPDAVIPPAPVEPPAPNLAFWTKTTIAPPARRQAIIPGRVQQSHRPPSLNAPPVLSRSNSQTVTSDVAAVLAPTQTAPKLALANSSTNPVRMQGKGGSEIASFAMLQSDPVNLIYLIADKPAPNHVEIPEGLQNAPRSGSGGGAENAAGRALNPGDRSNASGAAGRVRASAESDAAAAAAAASSRAATGASPASPGRPSAPDSTHVADPAPNHEPGVIRVAHPVNGNFDVVILRSASREDLPDVGATLSGNPVYTVYINVGDQREWLLEYCIPSNINNHSNPYMVNIDDPGVVAAPYPVSTAIPAKVLELQHSRHIALHGVLSTAGIFRNVTSTDMEDPLVREVLPLLSQWKFRPALRDKVPVEVEILLIIPARS